MHIWHFAKLVSLRLLTWNVANFLVGLALMVGNRFWRGVGIQAIGWSLINIGIALGGDWFTQRRLLSIDDPFEPEILEKEAASLQRILWINTALDVLYVAGGFALARTRGSSGKENDSFWRGNGAGIMIQGACLFVFDLLHALFVPEQRGTGH